MVGISNRLKTKRPWRLFSKVIASSDLSSDHVLLTPTTSHEVSPSVVPKSNGSKASGHDHAHTIPVPLDTKPASLNEQGHSVPSQHPLMDRAVEKHSKKCTAKKCPCAALDISHLQDELNEMISSKQSDKPWIREKLQTALPSLKGLEPWVDIIDAIAQVNPISGQVSGLVHVALKVAIVVGDQYDNAVDSVQYVREILYLLALYEKNGPPPDLVEDVIQAYDDVFNFLCIVNAHNHALKEAQDRLESSVKRLESKATSEILNSVQKISKLHSSAELERKRIECLKEIYDNGTPNEEKVDIPKPAEDTCKWVYDSSDSRELQPWRDWRDSKESGIMLIVGGIGTGKSTLAFNAINALRNFPSSQSRLVSASFCRAQMKFDNEEAILCGLLYGVVREDEEAMNILVEHRDDPTQKKVGRNLNAFKSFSLRECFTKCVQVRKKELCLVVDGLDECTETSRDQLLLHFKNLVENARKDTSSPPLKILFLSRPVTTITGKLSSSKRLHLADIRKSSDTRVVIEHLVGRDMFRLDDNERMKLISLLEEKADGCLQWATVIVGHLKRVPSDTLDGIESELAELSNDGNDLDRTYLELFKRQFNGGFADYADTALRLIAGAARPLSVHELANAMIVNPLRAKVASRGDFEKWAHVGRVRGLEPLVRISQQSSKILMHSSLRELISRTPHLGKSDSKINSDNPSSKFGLSKLLATTCLDYLLLPYFRNVDVRKEFDFDREEETEWLMCMNPDAEENGDELSENDEDQGAGSGRGPHFFAYAAEYWTQHLSDTDFPDNLIRKSLDLTAAASKQCDNWWKQYKFAKGQWEPQAPEAISPAVAAIYFEHKPVIESLLKDVQKQALDTHQDNAEHLRREDVVNYNTLELAIYMESYEIFKLLYKAATDDEIRTDGAWHLLTALQERREDVVEVLVNDPRVELSRRFSEHGHKTILTDMAIKKCNVETLRGLLRLLETERRHEIMGLLQDEGDDAQCSPLWYAAYWGHTDFVEALCCLDTDTIRPQLLCPGQDNIHIVATAARRGNRRIVEALLKHCPDYADRRCSDRDTPLSMTRENSDDKAADVAEVLLATGLVDIESTNDFDKTPLMGAFKSQKLELCKVLVRHSADISKIIDFSEHNSPICRVSSGFPVTDAENRDVLAKLYDEMKRDF
ncbi:hypothetical protein NA57DRAFT_71804 [Rhizodiscina lignyota]|uniref:Nephrocystin 3-like N-terminal domain-containing protein n=1 Tax=Rhizodiscina lignyota TaxID=1504668 RepID=A0A9P4MEP9_9PEZI|nr:hypothetical protein NA57DRAFT_71804 [Rhizodiscina lignyota]